MLCIRNIVWTQQRLLVFAVTATSNRKSFYDDWGKDSQLAAWNGGYAIGIFFSKRRITAVPNVVLSCLIVKWSNPLLATHCVPRLKVTSSYCYNSVSYLPVSRLDSGWWLGYIWPGIWVPLLRSMNIGTWCRGVSRGELKTTVASGAGPLRVGWCCLLMISKTVKHLYGVI